MSNKARKKGEIIKWNSKHREIPSSGHGSLKNFLLLFSADGKFSFISQNNNSRNFNLTPLDAFKG